MNAILTIIAAVGLANAISNEKAFDWLRDITEGLLVHSMLCCITCVAFWTGLAISIASGNGGTVSEVPIIGDVIIGLCSSILAKVVSIKFFTF